MDITVFYAWQADRPNKVNRRLIHDAAQDACREITEDALNDHTLSLDQDTQGIPGMCDIPNTILRKIRDCGIFLVDLTFVGRGESQLEDQPVRAISNPNAIFELGYAAGAKAADQFDGFERVIAVMNTAYGKPDEQMFDVKRRRPVLYDLPEDSDKVKIERVKKSLTNDIKDILTVMLGEAVFPDRDKAALERFIEIRNRFEDSVRDGKFHELYHENASAIAITVVPDAVQHIDYEKLDSQTIPFFGSGGGESRQRRGKSVLAVELVPNPENQTSRVSKYYH